MLTAIKGHINKNWHANIVRFMMSEVNTPLGCKAGNSISTNRATVC